MVPEEKKPDPQAAQVAFEDESKLGPVQEVQVTADPEHVRQLPLQEAQVLPLTKLPGAQEVQVLAVPEHVTQGAAHGVHVPPLMKLPAAHTTQVLLATTKA